MAELGVISSGLGVVSLAIQVADSIMKLKDFLDKVKEAPEEIKYLIRQIEVLSLVLSGCDTEEDEEGISEAVSAPMRTCAMFLSQAAGELEVVVKELEDTVGKRKKMGSLKAVLKQHLIDRLRQRLREAQDLLVLSKQNYSQARQKRYHELQRHLAEIQIHKLNSLESHVMQCTQAIQFTPQRLATSPARIEDHPSSEDDETHQNNTRLSYSESNCKELTRSDKRVTPLLTRQKATLARLKLPPWLRLTSYCLEICGQRSLYSMSLDVKVYRIVSHSSPIMEYARSGNVVAMQEMFSKRTATPHDTTIYGISVLEEAAQTHQIEVCRLLMNEGTYKYDSSALSACRRVIFMKNAICDSNKRIELIRILAEGVNYDDPLIFHTGFLKSFWGDTSVLSWMFNNLYNSHLNSTIEELALLAIDWCTRCLQYRPASLVRYLLPDSKDFITACHVKDSTSRTLLHGAAWAFGEQAFKVSQSSPTNILRRPQAPKSRLKVDHQAESECLQDLVVLLRDAVVAGSDLHGCASRFRVKLPYKGIRETPLTAIFSSFHSLSQFWIINKVHPGVYDQIMYLGPHTSTIDEVLTPVMMWLELLHEAGVDLAEYGRKEKDLWSEGRVFNLFDFFIWRRAMTDWDEVPRHSIMFEYGPNPSDWQFWFIEKMDNSFVEFWDMVDHPERAMPGAWEESSDEYESDEDY